MTLQHLALLLLLGLTALVARVVLAAMEEAPRGKLGGAVLRATDRFSFSPDSLGGFSWSGLALVSLLGLFLEVLMIRWVSAEVQIFAYFKNFILIACFLGFGLGCYMCRRRISLLALLLPLGTLVLLIKCPWAPLRSLVRTLPSWLGWTSEVQIWGVPSLPASAETVGPFAMGLAAAVALFSLVAFIFVPIGQLVGWCLENARRGILAYSVNVLASLAGILLYTLLCFLDQPPAVWFAIAGVVWLAIVRRVPAVRSASAAVFAACVVLVGLPPGSGSSVYWSPYQKLTLKPRSDAGGIIAYQLAANDSFYQRILDLSPRFVSTHPKLFEKVPVEWNGYNVPYRFYPGPSSVLVLGSGMGNDVAAALRNGAGRVVAVEIDPLIVSLGRRLHFEKPYASPRVVTVVDDARSYIQTGRDRFDLIVFSLLDSHTTASHYSNIRIDNYVYTREALEAARRLLAPDGVFIIKFQAMTPWIAGRLNTLLTTVFGRPPVQFQSDHFDYSSSGRFFVSGSEERIGRAVAEPEMRSYLDARRELDMEDASLTTDDWPFFYQHEPGIPFNIIAISLVLVVLARWLMGRTDAMALGVRWHFFFLGAGFLLLEAQIVSKMALLFGTTWAVNSIVVAALLLLIVAANLLVERWEGLSTSFAYAGLFLSIGAGWIIPLKAFFFESPWLRALASTCVLCLPVFFAGIVFIRSFAAAAFSGEALGSNLFGALVGGLLESISLWTGIRSLLLVAGLLYLASLVALRARVAVRASSATV